MSFHFVRLLSVYPRFSISFFLLSRTWSRCVGTRIFAIVDDEPKRKEAFKDRSQGWYQPDLRENPIMRTKHFHLRLINLFPLSYLQGTFIDDITNLYLFALWYSSIFDSIFNSAVVSTFSKYLYLVKCLLFFEYFIRKKHTQIILNTKTPSN